MDEPLTIAFHPSGLQIIVGFADKIRCMNICARNLNVYQELFIKSCREIKFSNGGHLFACIDNHNIKVFRFYQGDCPEGYTFKEHVNKVRSIAWFDDDSGFVSSGIDGVCLAWKLNPDSLDILNANRRSQEEEKTVKNFTYKTEYRQGRFVDVAIKSESKNTYYALTEDRHIKEIENGKEKVRFDTGYNYSSIVSFQGSKIIAAGVAEGDKPGAIQFFKNPWERLLEIQAHSSGVERIRLTFSNTQLLSAGSDGSLCVFDVKDKEPKLRKDGKELPTISHSEDILITKVERDKFREDVDLLRKEILIKKDA